MRPLGIAQIPFDHIDASAGGVIPVNVGRNVLSDSIEFTREIKRYLVNESYITRCRASCIGLLENLDDRLVFPPSCPVQCGYAVLIDLIHNGTMLQQQSHNCC